MLIITGTIKDALMRRAQRSRADEGNMDYVFSQNLEDPTEIRLTEKWESEATLTAHLQISDDEFAEVVGSAKIESAVVTSNEVTKERELLNR
mgnify:CR=1 FL=1